MKIKHRIYKNCSSYSIRAIGFTGLISGDCFRLAKDKTETLRLMRSCEWHPAIRFSISTISSHWFISNREFAFCK